MADSGALVPVEGWALALSPAGHVRVESAPGESAGSFTGSDPVAVARARAAFEEEGEIAGLLHLGAVEVDAALPPSLAFWRDVSRLFVAGLCSTPELDGKRVSVPFPRAEMERLARAAPPMTGSEYLSVETLARTWEQLEERARVELRAHGGTAQEWLSSRNEVWNRVGRVHFHLAENADDPEFPFAFMATYTDGLSAKARPAHRALGGALRRASGNEDRGGLLALLTPVQRAALKSPVVKNLVESGDLFHPLAWTAAQAHEFLREASVLEECGLALRVPDWWRGSKPARPVLQVRLGDKVPTTLGADALVDFQVELALGQHKLTEQEWMEILRAGDGLVRVKGHWVEVDRARLEQVLSAFRRARAAERDGGLPFMEAMRLVAGAVEVEDASAAAEALREVPGWSEVVGGEWLAGVLEGLRGPVHALRAGRGSAPGPGGLAGIAPPKALRATLRTYQVAGMRWMWLVGRLGLGACLADDMGLGKTIQVLALIVASRERKETTGPHLLVAPATLISNWRAEIERFVPDLRVAYAHPSYRAAHPPPENPELVITSYGFLQRTPELLDASWDLVVIDEAQAIKNPGAGQTRAVKKLHSRRRVALTGTPIENRLGDLWSLFDFLNPGLLGSAAQFKGLARSLTKTGFGPLRELVRPYLLRRLKGDVAKELPPKTEVLAWCGLTKSQAGYYKRAVDELQLELAKAKAGGRGVQRKGVILSYLLRFKQICNHPAQWLGGGAFDVEGSGKLARLATICGEIADRQEKALVFTQFQEMTGPLASFLEGVFGKPGLVLHGGTPVRTRGKLVETFQADDGPPFFVISLKAGGTGLNLTAATHVIHFDRWWNPAVEAQATDRAHRIGQTRNVLVHKMVVRGTVEEKIEALLEAKRGLSRDVLGGDAGPALTELPDEELLRLVALDSTRALEVN